MRKTKIAIQGISASFHDQAARAYFGQDIELVECHSFEASCRAVDENRADYCVLAIENSIAGSILSNYNLIKSNGLSIIGELYQRIELHLLVWADTPFSSISTIKSHPIALRQCSDFMLKNEHLHIIEAGDTGTCARQLATDKNTNLGVIASETAARHYGLTILEKNIETNKQNFTRFHILSKGQQIETSANKATICFNLHHEPGSLLNALQILDKNFVNLTKIQSVPILGDPRHYHFYVDVEYFDKYIFEQCLQQLKNKTVQLTVLGQYHKKEFQSVTQ